MHPSIVKYPFPSEKIETRRYFNIADLTIQLTIHIHPTKLIYHPLIVSFENEEPTKDIIGIEQYFQLPQINFQILGRECYNKYQWKIYKNQNYWTYLSLDHEICEKAIHGVAIFNNDYTEGWVYHNVPESFKRVDLSRLIPLFNDQILFVPILSSRNGIILHASSCVYRGSGIMFVGHSGSGKSTMIEMLIPSFEILNEDRTIVRRRNKDFFIYGSWLNFQKNPGSSKSAPLKAIFFLEKSKDNSLELLSNTSLALNRIIPCIVRSLETQVWWENTLEVINSLVSDVPCYMLRFNKSGKIVNIIKSLINKDGTVF